MEPDSGSDHSDFYDRFKSKIDHKKKSNWSKNQPKKERCTRWSTIDVLFSYHLIYIILACRVEFQPKKLSRPSGKQRNYASQKKIEKLIVEKSKIYDRIEKSIFEDRSINHDWKSIFDRNH